MVSARPQGGGRPTSEGVERDKQMRWLRKLRDKTQHLSLVLRPQCVRQLWMREKDKYKKG